MCVYITYEVFPHVIFEDFRVELLHAVIDE
jgi:hypothetical protein